MQPAAQAAIHPSRSHLQASVSQQEKTSLMQQQLADVLDGSVSGLSWSCQLSRPSSFSSRLLLPQWCAEALAGHLCSLPYCLMIIHAWLSQACQCYAMQCLMLFSKPGLVASLYTSSVLLISATQLVSLGKQCRRGH